jgi:predicted metal-dependent hydrolase
MKLMWMPQQYVRVTIPYRCPLREGLHFLQQNGPWVEQKMKEHAKLPGFWEYFRKHMMVSYNGKWLPCELSFDALRKGVVLERRNGSPCLMLYHPPVFIERELDVASLLVKWAKTYLPQRTLMWAESKKLAPRRVTVRNQISRWGSCSQLGEISLNWRLILLPPDIQDYVILHELAHMKEFNHSNRFWKLLEQWVPDTKRLDSELRGEQGTRILYLGR